MNARQKAKKYKQQIEEYKRMMIHPTIHVVSEELEHYKCRSIFGPNEMHLVESFDNPDNFIRLQHTSKVHQEINNLITPDMLEYKDNGRCAEFEMWIRRTNNG